MKLLYALFSAAILALGVLHMATTFWLTSSSVARVWFFGGGIAIALDGVLNLLNRRYGFTAPGLRAACIGTNLLMACFAGVAGRVSGASVAAEVVILAVLISIVVLSAVRSASIGPHPPRV
jgi:hypothetical protein